MFIQSVSGFSASLSRRLDPTFSGVINIFACYQPMFWQVQYMGCYACSRNFYAIELYYSGTVYALSKLITNGRSDLGLIIV
jgi:hypothetical protein